jgi:hypothetical protein
MIHLCYESLLILSQYGGCRKTSPFSGDIYSGSLKPTRDKGALAGLMTQTLRMSGKPLSHSANARFPAKGSFNRIVSMVSKSRDIIRHGTPKRIKDRRQLVRSHCSWAHKSHLSLRFLANLHSVWNSRAKSLNSIAEPGAMDRANFPSGRTISLVLHGRRSITNVVQSATTSGCGKELANRTQ